MEVEVPLDHKKCNKCQEIIPLSGFYKRKRGGVTSACIQCERKRYKAYKKEYLKIEQKYPNVNNSNLIVKTRPELLKYWDFLKNASIKNVTIGSGNIFHWKCYKCAHSWKNSPHEINRRNYICEKCFISENSFGELNPELIPLWSLKNKETPFQAPVYDKKKFLWQCPCGNDYKSRVESVLNSKHRVCPDCLAKLGTSSGEKDLADFVLSLCDEDDVVFNGRKILSGQELDIYIPSKKIAIEYNGLYWHSEKFKEKRYHYNKWKTCQEKGVELISIWEDDWENRESAVKHMLKKKMGFLEQKERINPTVDIREIERQEKKSFTEKYSIAKIPLVSRDFGVFQDDELLAVFSLSLLNGKTTVNFGSYAEKCDMSFCSSDIMNFVKDYARKENVKEISVVIDNSFSDMKKILDRDFNTVTYLDLNFSYIVQKKRVSRSSSRKFTEEEKSNLLKIYDCGTTKYSYFL